MTNYTWWMVAYSMVVKRQESKQYRRNAVIGIDMDHLADEMERVFTLGDVEDSVHVDTSGNMPEYICRTCATKSTCFENWCQHFSGRKNVDCRGRISTQSRSCINATQRMIAANKANPGKATVFTIPAWG